MNGTEPVVRYSLWLAEEETLWLETAGGGVWLGLTVGEDTLSTLYTVSLADLRRAAEGLAAVVARLEREEQQ